MSSRKWDRDSIRDALRKLYRDGEDLAYNAMCAKHQAIVSAAAYHFGSYRQAVLMAGLEYTRIRKKPRWTEEKVVSMIRRAKRNGEDLSWRAVTARGDDLARAAMAAVHPQLFGHWNDALEAAGLSPRRISRYRRWTKQTIVEELKSRKAKKQEITAGAMQDTLPGLYGAAVRIFGTYPKALEAAGIEPQQVVRRRDWTRARVLRTLREFASQHRTLSHTVIRKRDPGLLRAVYKYFGTIGAARKKVVTPQPTLFDVIKPAGAPRNRRPGANGQARWKRPPRESRQMALFDAPPPAERPRRRQRKAAQV